jgi:primosomal protein N' (replication factor Y)
VPAGCDLALGDVVRVPLGPRVVWGFVVSGPRDEAEPPPNLRAIAGKADVPRAFDRTGFGLAAWIADAYLCTLGEALSAVVLTAALPRAVERYILAVRPASSAQHDRVPARLLDFIWNDCPDGFTLETFLRAPEVRRAGDRRAILGYLRALVAAGALTRTRSITGARVNDALVRFLQPGDVPVAGKKAAALVAFVRECRELKRSEAVLAGYSDAVIRRAIALGALVETQRPIDVVRNGRSNLPDFAFTAEQRTAIERIDALVEARAYAQVLLHGITGSGKTLVYLATIAKVIAAGERAIVLVPEISLTPQTARRFEDAFGDRVAVLHSALSDRERFDAWQAAARGEIAVVVGARSAIFAPLGDVRLVVVDEEHEASYKQDSVPRYSAVEVARERMRRAGGVLVLGSATPAIEDYARARAGRYPLLTLRERATAQALPRTHVVDMSAQFAAGNRRIFSTPLLSAIDARLQRGEKAVLFVNRRGTAPFLLCRACGHVPQCARCSVSLTVHRSEELLRCHYCDAQKALPQTCPSCGTGPIRALGVGTQRVAHELLELFPNARIVRMDSDTTTRVGDHARLLERFVDDGDILVGTQMVAKGLDFPQVTLAGAIAADLDLHVADFRAAERTFALLTQVCGRSGRAQPGEAFIQTYSPEHPAIAFAAAHDYDGFAAGELADRRVLRWPPFTRLIYLGIIGRDRAAVEAAAERYAALMRDDERWEVLGPAPYAIARLNEEWRYRFALKTRDIATTRAAVRERIVSAARNERATRIAINVDP